MVSWAASAGVSVVSCAGGSTTSRAASAAALCASVSISPRSAGRKIQLPDIVGATAVGNKQQTLPIRVPARAVVAPCTASQPLDLAIHKTDLPHVLPLMVPAPFGDDGSTVR